MEEFKRIIVEKNELQWREISKMLALLASSDYQESNAKNKKTVYWKSSSSPKTKTSISVAKSKKC